MILLVKVKSFERLKFLGLPNKTSVGRATALKVNNTMNFETKSTLDVFKNYYSTLAEKNPKPSQQINF